MVCWLLILLICISTVVTWQRQFPSWNCQTSILRFNLISNKQGGNIWTSVKDFPFLNQSSSMSFLISHWNQFKITLLKYYIHQGFYITSCIQFLILTVLMRMFPHLSFHITMQWLSICDIFGNISNFPIVDNPSNICVSDILS